MFLIHLFTLKQMTQEKTVWQIKFWLNCKTSL